MQTIENFNSLDNLDALCEAEQAGPPRPVCFIERFEERLIYVGCEGFWANGEPMYVYALYTPIIFRRELPMLFFPTDLEDFEF